ncbi:hypothetical protein EV561_14119 [Rhizobium sp. BK376]|nr:hypothetical protein EV561_14119 [Rhizobium sp. BK376]
MIGVISQLNDATVLPSKRLSIPGDIITRFFNTHGP